MRKAMQGPVDVLDPAQRADLATQQILRRQLGTIEANVEGARQNLDSEYLHDLRVATRRTRSALSQIKGVFPEPTVTDFKARFAWLQQVTGPVRDLDVYLLDFPTLRQRLPAPLQPDLEPLYQLLLAQHAKAQQQLALELASPRFKQLLEDWRAFLDAPVAVDAARAEALPTQAALPIKQVADQRIRTLLKRMRAEGRAISEASPPEDLHELRKSGKKLRYLMEFFQSLYEKKRICEQIKQTKRLLDNLGHFQDTAVQARHLRETADASGGETRLPSATWLAMGALIGQLLQDQARARDGFAEVFAGFDSAENAVRFKTLLADDSALRRKRARKR